MLRPMDVHPIPLAADRSYSIRVARVLCILFMMTTHAWPGSERILAIQGPTQIVYVIIVDFLGRAAVPLLSAISGLLFVYTFARKLPAVIILSKIKTLIVPMTFWSLPMIVIAYGRFKLGAGPDPNLHDARVWLDGLLAITSQPANGPLHFLRDIFVMAIYGIAIMIIYARSKLTGVLLAIFILFLEQIPGGFLLFRNQIATMYIFGMLLACFGMANWKPSWWLVSVFLSALAIVGLTVGLEDRPENHVLFRFWEHLPRLAMSLLMWRIAIEVSGRRGAVRDKILALEPHIFTIFCTHAIFATLFGGAALVVGLHESDAIYIVILGLQLGAFVIGGIAISGLIAPFPWLRGKSS